MRLLGPWFLCAEFSSLRRLVSPSHMLNNTTEDLCIDESGYWPGLCTQMLALGSVLNVPHLLDTSKVGMFFFPAYHKCAMKCKWDHACKIT